MTGDKKKPNDSVDLLAAAMRRVHREAVEGAGEPLQRRDDAAVDTSTTEDRSERAESAD